ncbi:hypothetical protein F4804DRAFT_321864 [Jackrogersella minutella]|nr:hypothetical protein F4804DRAFT_321864 [Jackrogersella minutella]
MPLAYLSNWAPFRIDALGLVTLIGAEEVNRSVGRLVQSRYAKYLPLLGAHLIADNEFTAMTSGFHLYNVSDAIMTPGLSAWVTRWLNSQDLNTSTTSFEWSVAPGKPQETKSGCGKAWDALLAALVGFLTIGGSFVLTVAMGDWWGLANTISMAVSVLVRCCLVQENVNALDKAVFDACYERSGIQGGSEKVKLLISLADSRMVTMYAPRGLVLEGFTKRLTILRPRLYSYTRALGWFVFGVHVLSLGQAEFLNQIYAIVLLVLSTWATAKGIGSDEYNITEHISAKRVEDFPLHPDRRKWAYIRLECNEVEEESLADWGLLPRKANTMWWEDFNECKEQWEFQECRKSYDTAKT